MRCVSTLLVSIISVASSMYVLLTPLIGDNLALFTLGAERTNNLNIYDVRRQDPRASRSIKLEPFRTKVDSDGEVNVATFSPDSIYLTVARNDNTTHVYDSRMIERGVLYDFKHRGKRRTNPGSDSYGVVEARWIMSRSSRLGLVTGGDDGQDFSLFYSEVKIELTPPDFPPTQAACAYGILFNPVITMKTGWLLPKPLSMLGLFLWARI